MRLATVLSFVALIGGVGCASAERPPPAMPHVDPADVPLTAPDDPPVETRPKLTSPVTIGETPAGVPTQANVAANRLPASGSAPGAADPPPWTRRDLFAEDRAGAARIAGSSTSYRHYHRYGHHPMHLGARSSIAPVSPPRGTPAVGGNWPAPRSHGTPAIRSRVH